MYSSKVKHAMLNYFDFYAFFKINFNVSKNITITYYWFYLSDNSHYYNKIVKFALRFLCRFSVWFVFWFLEFIPLGKYSQNAVS